MMDKSVKIFLGTAAIAASGGALYLFLTRPKPGSRDDNNDDGPMPDQAAPALPPKPSFATRQYGGGASRPSAPPSRPPAPADEDEDDFYTPKDIKSLGPPSASIPPPPSIPDSHTKYRAEVEQTLDGSKKGKQLAGKTKKEIQTQQILEKEIDIYKQRTDNDRLRRAKDTEKRQKDYEAKNYNIQKDIDNQNRNLEADRLRRKKDTEKRQKEYEARNYELQKSIDAQARNLEYERKRTEAARLKQEAEQEKRNRGKKKPTSSKKETYNSEMQNRVLDFMDADRRRSILTSIAQSLQKAINFHAYEQVLPLHQLRKENLAPGLEAQVKQIRDSIRFGSKDFAQNATAIANKIPEWQAANIISSEFANDLKQSTILILREQDMAQKRALFINLHGALLKALG